MGSSLNRHCTNILLSQNSSTRRLLEKKRDQDNGDTLITKTVFYQQQKFSYNQKKHLNINATTEFPNYA